MGFAPHKAPSLIPSDHLRPTARYVVSAVCLPAWGRRRPPLGEAVAEALPTDRWASMRFVVAPCTQRAT